MNKSELIAAVAEQTGLTKVETGRVLEAVLESITGAVTAGDTVALVGFGSFKATTRGAREGRNPATGAVIQIAETTLPKFQPGATFKARVEAGAKPPEPAPKAPAKRKPKAV